MTRPIEEAGDLLLDAVHYLEGLAAADPKRFDMARNVATGLREAFDLVVCIQDGDARRLSIYGLRPVALTQPEFEVLAMAAPGDASAEAIDRAQALIRLIAFELAEEAAKDGPSDFRIDVARKVLADRIDKATARARSSISDDK